MMATDRQLMTVVSHRVYEAPSAIAKRVGSRRINAQLGRLIRTGQLERVPGPRCFLYRSRQTSLL